MYLPSTCTDLVDSTTNPGEKTSTEPCVETPHLIKNISYESAMKNGKFSVFFLFDILTILYYSSMIYDPILSFYDLLYILHRQGKQSERWWSWNAILK